MTIKLINIRHEDRRGNITYVLPGGYHTVSAIEAINVLDTINRGARVTVLKVTVQPHGRGVTRRTSNNSRVSIL